MICFSVQQVDVLICRFDTTRSLQHPLLRLQTVMPASRRGLPVGSGAWDPPAAVRAHLTYMISLFSNVERKTLGGSLAEVSQRPDSGLSRNSFLAKRRQVLKDAFAAG